MVQEIPEIHPELSERMPETQDRCHNRMSNCHVMDQYFKLLNNEINTLELTDHPDRLFNCDETGWNGKEKSKIKVLAVKGEHAYQQSVLSSSGHITALMCVSADGRVYQHSSFSRRLSLTHHTRMALQETGCSDIT